MTDYRTNAYSRIALNDFVYAVDNPTSANAYFDYVKANKWIDNVDYGWDAFQFAHTEDGDHLRMTQIDNFTVENTISVTLEGNADINAGELARILIGGEYTYVPVYNTYYDAVNDETLVVFDEPVTDLASATAIEIALVRDIKAIPEVYSGAYRVNNAINILGSNGDWESDIINASIDITRIRTFGHFYLDGAASPTITLSKSEGSFSVVATFSIGDTVEGLSISAGDDIKVNIDGADGVVCQAFGFEYGG